MLCDLQPFPDPFKGLLPPYLLPYLIGSTTLVGTIFRPLCRRGMYIRYHRVRRLFSRLWKTLEIPRILPITGRKMRHNSPSQTHQLLRSMFALDAHALRTPPPPCSRYRPDEPMELLRTDALHGPLMTESLCCTVYSRLARRCCRRPSRTTGAPESSGWFRDRGADVAEPETLQSH